MYKERAKKTFSLLFISIFMIKMIIAAVPLLYSFNCNGTVRAVILQLEIEDNKEKPTEKMKELTAKDYCSLPPSYTFELPLSYIDIKRLAAEAQLHIQTFYPPVPTPPPNCV
jgi:hypothetical protein